MRHKKPKVDFNSPEYLAFLSADDREFLEEERARWRKEAASRRRTLLKRYAITEDVLDRLVLECEGRCLICETPDPRLVVDHSHTNGAVRGLLCNTCNTGLGMLEYGYMERAVAYLKERG